MKIVFFHPGILPVSGYGGIERILFWHMVELVKQGHKVVLIGNSESKVKEHGIELIVIKDQENWEDQIPSDADILHMSFNCEMKTNIPVIFTVHGNGKVGEVFHKNSVFVSRKHAEIHGSDQFVYNALDFSEYPYLPKKERKWEHFLFLAKASWRVKNLKDSVRAARNGKKHIHVAGGRWWGLSRFVHNHGIVGGEAKMNIIRNCDFMVFPVRWHEPFGIAVIEAMSQGLPVIGSHYGSLPELITEEAGFIVKNHEELSARVAEDHSLKFNPDTIRKYAEEKFGITKYSKDYLALYEKVIRNEFLNSINPKSQFSERAENLLPF